MILTPINDTINIVWPIKMNYIYVTLSKVTKSFTEKTVHKKQYKRIMRNQDKMKFENVNWQEQNHKIWQH